MSSRSDNLILAVDEDLGNLVIGDYSAHNMPPDATYRQFSATYLRSNLLKKFVQGKFSDADDNAMRKFETSNLRCRDWVLPALDERDSILLNLMKVELDGFFHPEGDLLFSSYDEILAEGRTGPGSAIQANGQSFYAKMFASNLTCTSPSLYFEYINYIAKVQDTWAQADKNRRSSLGSFRVVNGSKISFAPKTTDVSRLICVEPSLNQFYQLGLGRLMEARLRSSFKVDLSTQPDINRRLARSGSIDGGFSTIDLSSASDSISLGMCKELLPGWVYDTLLEIRSPTYTFKGQSRELFMMSTMGNGFTFPLQTIIFSSLIRAVYRFLDIPLGDRVTRTWACFGDDIIVKRETFDTVIRLLGLLGFDVNQTKTFSKGRFRESCGSDWLFGQPVRPVFVKKLDSLQDIFVAINLLNMWSAYTGLPLVRAVQYLLSLVRRGVMNHAIPFDENIDAGVRVPYRFFDINPKRDLNGSVVYHVTVPVPRKIFIREESIKTPRGMKKLHFNPQGLFMSLLHGELVSGTISVRHDSVRYRSKSRVTPRWDYYSCQELLNGMIPEWQRWETAVLVNTSNPSESWEG